MWRSKIAHLVVSRTAVRGERCRLARYAAFAKRRHVTDCTATACGATASRNLARNCQNGIDCELYAFDCTLSVNDRSLSLAVWRDPGVVSTSPVIDSTSPVVDSRSPFLKIPTSMTPLETSHRRREASCRRLEVLFRCQKALGRQLGVVNFEMCGFQLPSRGSQSFVQTVQSITSLDHSCDRIARAARSTRHRTRRAREPPGQFGWNLGRDFSRPL